MTKASDNVFPRLLISEGGSTSTPASGNVTVYAKANGLLYSKDDAGTETALGAGGAAASSLLAVKAYASGSDVVVGATTGSTSFVDVDATNAAVTFTAPASTNVLVRLSGLQSGDNAAGIYFWGLRESSSDIGTPWRVGQLSLVGLSAVAVIYLAGISGGSHTYKWSHRVSANNGGIYAGPTIGQIIMEVWAAP